MNALARELDTTPGMVQIMLEGLADRGYVKPYAGSQSCSGCALAGACAGHSAGAACQWISTRQMTNA